VAAACSLRATAPTAAKAADDAVHGSRKGGDPTRVVYMGMRRDSQETRIGDIPHSARPFIDVTSNERIAEEQVVGLPDNVAKHPRESA
jgi:putative hydrolase of HD superfamily